MTPSSEPPESTPSPAASESLASSERFPRPSAAAGEVDEPLPRFLLRAEPVEINAGRRTATLLVENTGDRAIQVGSHYHFFEANRALRFDRDAAFGMRLGIPAGTAVRFEPGDRREVSLVAMGGTRRVVGFSGAVNGSVAVPRSAPSPDSPAREPAPATPVPPASVPPASTASGESGA